MVGAREGGGEINYLFGQRIGGRAEERTASFVRLGGVGGIRVCGMGRGGAVSVAQAMCKV